MSAPASRTSVAAVMTHGVITCTPQTPLAEVAQQMADHGVHSVVVEGLARGPGEREHMVWGIVSDLDVMRAAAEGDLDLPAERVAATEIVTVSPEDSVERAAQLMGEHEVSHLVVIAQVSGEPAGVLSTLDVIEAIAAGSRGPVAPEM